MWAPVIVAEQVPAAVAAEQAESGITVFDPAFFAAARPNTAFDMIQRVPGFALDTGESVRGFGGAAGNVLVNGRRPSSKADSLTEILQRIPAASVARIELIRGAAPGIDMQGRSVLVNVVLLAGARSETVAAVEVRAYGDGRLAPNGQIDWSRSNGDHSLSASAAYADEDGGEYGNGSETVRSATGTLLDDASVIKTDIDRSVRLRGSGQAPLLGGIGHLNLSLNYDFTDKSDRVSHRLAPSPVDTVAERFRTPSGEIGADFTRRFGPRLEVSLVALQSFRRRHYRSAAEEGGIASTFGQRRFSGESILRASVLYTVSPSLSLRGGAEGAFNFLDGRSQFTENGITVPLPNAQVRVEERRGELFGSTTWAMSPALNLEAGVRVEASTISQSGDSNRATSFFFPKPRVMLTWSPSPAWQTRLRLEREVGQLNFADFVASASFSNGTVNAGNADLEPERRWVAELAVERRFWGEGSVVVTVTHAALQQVVDQVPVNGFSAPGNIGNGRRDTVRVALTAPLRRIGLGGGLLNLDVRRLWSRVTDPTTGERRMISNDTPWLGSLTFSNDMPRLRSTFTLRAELGEVSREYRIDEIFEERYGPQLHLAWEYKPNQRLSILFELNNLTGRARDFTRYAYPGLRNAVPLGFVDLQSIRFPRFAHLRIRQTF